MKKIIVIISMLILLFPSLVFCRQNYETEAQIIPYETEEQDEYDNQTQIKKKINLKDIFEQPQVSLTISKNVVCNVWHTECDLMGDKYWVKDPISNPQGISSKEGHRINHCGAKDSWFIYLDKKGKPYAMLEMKAGSTNDLIPLPATFYTDNTYTQLRDPATIKVGERIYWTTQNKGQKWHHTGVTRLDIPTFEFVIDGKSYFLKPGQSIEIPDMTAGQHTIIEKYNKDYIINDVNKPFTIDKDSNVVISVNVNKGSQVVINFENKPIHMPDPPEQIQTQEQTETQAPIIQTQKPIQTQAPIIQTQTPVETQIPVETQVEIQTPITETETPVTQTQTPVIETETPITQTQAPIIETQAPVIQTELITQAPIIETQIIETETQKETQIQQTERVTQKQTEVKQTEKQTEPKNSKPIILQTQKQTQNKSETIITRNNGVLGQDRQKDTQKTENLQMDKSKNKKQSISGNNRSTEPIIQSVTGTVTSIPKTGDKTPFNLFLELYIGSIIAIISIAIFIYLTNKKK